MSINFYKPIAVLAAGIQGLAVHAFLGQELIRFELLNKTRLGANSFLDSLCFKMATWCSSAFRKSTSGNYIFSLLCQYPSNPGMMNRELLPEEVSTEDPTVEF